MLGLHGPTSCFHPEGQGEEKRPLSEAAGAASACAGLFLKRGGREGSSVLFLTEMSVDAPLPSAWLQGREL